MSSVFLLDCTLRDGGYINNWQFTDNQIMSTVANLTNAKIDFIELGYITSITSTIGGSQFGGISEMSKFIPENKQKSSYLAMADCSMYDILELENRTAQTVDGIRVVFYKRQIEQAFRFCEGVVEKGYDLIIQPMVTIDYSINEYEDLIMKFQETYPLYSVAVVDSFGCMNGKQINQYVRMLDNCLSKETKIGLHGHNNRNLALQNALEFINMAGEREIIIDASVNGMGRGAGNLCTELISDYLNENENRNYNTGFLIQIMSEITEPISKKYSWGYNPFHMLTAKYKVHPNFAKFILENHYVSVNEFADILKMIPESMRTKCTRPYVEELYTRYMSERR